MHIHIIQHAAFEPSGTINDWITQHQYHHSVTHSYRADILPSHETFNVLIIMGGPQSPRNMTNAPYLQQEINLIRNTLQQQKSILGFCLGAQLISEALGATTLASEQPEVGLYPIQLTAAAADDPVFSQLPLEFDVMHWHSDMPGLSDDTVLLAQSEGCSRQAFRYGDRVYGLQFHLETTTSILQSMIKHCPDDLSPGPYKRTRGRIAHG